MIAPLASLIVTVQRDSAPASAPSADEMSRYETDVAVSSSAPEVHVIVPTAVEP